MTQPRDACKVWIGPAIINNKEYNFPVLEKVTDGSRLWSVSVALADYVSKLTLTGNSIEIGCGLGLVGRVVDAVLIDKDTTLPDVIHQNWKDVTDTFDNIFGSEMIYPAYDPASIADFVDRCWTRKGICLFAVSRPQFAQSFESRLSELNIKFVKEIKTYSGFEYTIWELSN